MATAWLLQRGSPESKPLDKAGRESDQEQKIGPSSLRSRRAGPGRGLGDIAVLELPRPGDGLIFFACWFVQSFTGRVAFDEQQIAQLQAPVSWLGYVGSPDFWSRTLQNWQSEFLAVGPWRCSRSTCGSGDHPSPSRSVRGMPAPVSRLKWPRDSTDRGRH